jgi:hypothetical protein
LAVTLDSLKTKDGGRSLDRFDETRSLRSASTFSISSPSDLISPSSRFSDPLTPGNVLSSTGLATSG